MKKLLSLLLAAALLLALTACGETDKPADTSSEAPVSSKEPVNIAAADLAALLFKGIEYEDDIDLIGETPEENIEIVAAYYDFDESLLADAAIYMGSNATPEEICVMKSATDDVSALKAAAEGRLATRIEDFTDYNPEQMPKLDTAVIYTSGRYVVFSVSGNAEAAMKILKENLG